MDCNVVFVFYRKPFSAYIELASLVFSNLYSRAKTLPTHNYNGLTLADDGQTTILSTHGGYPTPTTKS